MRIGGSSQKSPDETMTLTASQPRSAPAPVQKDNPAAPDEVFIFPATVAQRRFWLLDQMQPGNPALNVPLAARLAGRLDRELLERAANEIIRRHEILRTSFQLHGKDPVQVIHPQKNIRLAWFDISPLPESGREMRVHELLLEEGQRPFVLTDGLFLRGGLIRLHDEEHILMLTMHHIVCDGWSNGIVMREIAQIYNAFLAGGKLEELPLQYADFAQWQEDWLASPAVAKHHQFWQSQLQGTLPFLNLPTDRPRQPSRSHKSTIHTRLLPRSLSDAINDLCHRENLTPFMVYLTAYATLLQRYTGQRDIIIASPAANRSQPDLEGLIGLFSNPLVMRLHFSSNLTLRFLLRQVKALSLEVLEHQAYPFEKLIEEIQTDPLRSGLQWLQAYFVFQKAFMQSQQMGNVTLTPLRSISPGTLFEWMLGVLERPEGVRLQLEYNTDLFAHSTIDRLLHHFQQLLETMVSKLDFRIDALPILTPEEQKRIILDWNHARLEIPRDQCVHELFAEQSRLTPQAVAVQTAGQQITYAQLDRRANQVAQLVKARGGRPHPLVGLVLDESSSEFPACFLGVLKAGGCCVVLDPRNRNVDPERLANPGRLDLLLLESSPAAARPWSPALPAINLADEPALAGEPLETKFTDLMQAEQPACVWFTSAGRGVILSHRALLNSTLVARRELGLHRQDRVTGSLTELLPALLAGATLVLPDRLDRFVALAWWPWVCAREITVAALPTPCWHELVRSFLHHPAGTKSKLRLMAIGGSPVSGNALSAWQPATAGRISLVDRYLLTETAGAVAYTRLPSADASPSPAAITQPAPNTQIYLLDDHQRPVPIGVPGHLYVGGSSLASGCWPGSGTVAPDSPAGKSADPPGGRRLKTSDTGRFLANGGIELLGRIEDLEKTNDFRLELSEIRSVILGHSQVWDALVLPRQISGTETLVAYVITKDDRRLPCAELRAFVANHLPAYMVPSGFVIRPEFPLTPTGKIDRHALPPPGDTRPDQGDQFVAPGSQTEVALAKLWCQLLRLRQISIQANFFALGGHSLLAVRMVGEIRRQIAPGMPVRLPFQYPTIQSLAQALLTQKFTARKPELIELQPGSAGPETFLIIDGDSVGLFKLSRHLGRELRLFASVVPLPEPAVKASANQQSAGLPPMEELAAPHAALIQGRPNHGPIVLVGYCMAGMLAFEVAHQLQRAGIQVLAVLMLNTWMKRPTWWWLKHAWLREYFGKLIHQGPLFLWHKSQDKIKKEKLDLAARHTLACHHEFGLLVPQSIVDRINRHAVTGYQPRPLASRGVLFVFEDDWRSKAYLPIDSSLGANGLFQDGLQVIQVPANNVTVLDETHLATVAEYFNQCVRQFQ